jgi:hypothetical protein
LMRIKTHRDRESFIQNLVYLSLSILMS